MGLHVSIYRPAGRSTDCTAGGISSRGTGLCLVNVPGPFDPSADAAPAMLVAHNVFGEDVGRRMVRIVPARQNAAGEWQPLNGWIDEDAGRTWYWPMFGGNYAGSSDSRLGDAIEKLLGTLWHGAVAIHDRFES